MFFLGWAEDMKDTSDRSTTCPWPKVRQQGIAGSAAPALRKVDFQGTEGEIFPQVFLGWEKKVPEKTIEPTRTMLISFFLFCGLEGSSFLGRCRGGWRHRK